MTLYVLAKMSFKTTAVLCLVFATCVVLSTADKYNKDVNRVDRGPENIEPKFKHKQVNKVWDKALRKNLHTSKLNDLQKQLKKIDEKYLINKKERMTPDVSPEQFKDQERIIDGLLEDVMMKFDIIPSKDGIFGGNFRDRRIADLWTSALKSEQFSKEELDILRKDLEEHQSKVEEFQSAMQDHRKPTPHENEVGGAGEKKDPIEQRAADIDMKLKHRDLTQNFQRLSVKVIPENERGGFTDHKVIQLWQEAVKSNFDAEELEELRQELIEFEKEIQRNDELHKTVLHAEKDHLSSKNRSDMKNPEARKEKKGLLASTREELQSVSKKVTELMRNFKEKLGKAGKKSEL